MCTFQFVECVLSQTQLQHEGNSFGIRSRENPAKTGLSLKMVTTDRTEESLYEDKPYPLKRSCFSNAFVEYHTNSTVGEGHNEHWQQKQDTSHVHRHKTIFQCVRIRVWSEDARVESFRLKKEQLLC